MSELAGISTAPTKLKPGMTHVVHAGESLVIRDANNEEFAVEARESRAVMEFLLAFAEERRMRLRNVSGPVLREFGHETERLFLALPAHVARQLG